MAAGATVELPLQVTSSVAFPFDYKFTLEAAGGLNGDMANFEDLVVPSPPATPPNPTAFGVAAMLTPILATIGQGTSAQYTLQITNTGSADDSFSYVVSGLPTGIGGNLSQNNVDVPPGASNFRDLRLTLTAQPGTTPGTYSFTVRIFSANASTTLSGTVTVVAEGVSVSLNPPSGSPGATFSMLVTNAPGRWQTPTIWRWPARSPWWPTLLARLP